MTALLTDVPYKKPNWYNPLWFLTELDRSLACSLLHMRAPDLDAAPANVLVRLDQLDNFSKEMRLRTVDFVPPEGDFLMQRDMVG